MSHQPRARPIPDNGQPGARVSVRVLRVVALVMCVGALAPWKFYGATLHTSAAAAATLSTPSRSTTIALTLTTAPARCCQSRSEQSFRYSGAQRAGKDVSDKLDEIPVGLEPRCVAVQPGRRRSVRHQRHQRHRVGRRPGQGPGRGDDPGRHRAAGLRPDPERKPAVRRQPHAGHGVHHRHAATRKVSGPSRRRNPTALAITNDGDNKDADERVFVTQIFAELIPRRSW